MAKKKSKKQRKKVGKSAAKSAPKATARATAPVAAMIPPPPPPESRVEAVVTTSLAEATREAVVAEEHRAAQRVSMFVEIHMASDSHFFSGLSGDISEGGVFVSTYRPLAQGDTVELEFSLPGSHDSIRVQGEVRWLREHSAHEPRGVGIAFDALPEEARDRIHAFCTVRPPLYYDDVG